MSVEARETGFAGKLSVPTRLAGWRPTAREFQALRLVAIQGMTRAEAAAEMGIAPNTVRAHLAHVAVKLGRPMRLIRRDLRRHYYADQEGTWDQEGQRADDDSRSL